MKVQKTWLTVRFGEGNTAVEASLNYEDGTYYVNQKGEDMHVTFRSEKDLDIDASIERSKNVIAALKYIQKEFA